MARSSWLFALYPLGFSGLNMEACFRIDLAADCVLNVNSGLISLEDHRAAAPATPEVIRNLFQI